MIQNNLGGGLLLCLINLVVVMTVLGAIAWVIGLVSRLLNRSRGTEQAAAPATESVAEPAPLAVPEPVSEPGSDPATGDEPEPQPAGPAAAAYVDMPIQVLPVSDKPEPGRPGTDR